jgi:hypothetical protein
MEHLIRVLIKLTAPMTLALANGYTHRCNRNSACNRAIAGSIDTNLLISSGQRPA